MPRQGAYWTVSFESSNRLRDAERGKEEGGEACARGDYCAGRRIVTEGGERKIIPGRAYSGFCHACRDLVARCLSELPSLWQRLAAEIGEASQSSRGIRTPLGPRLPLRADVDELMRAIAEVLASWEERTRDIARLSPLDTQLSRRRDPGKAVAQSVKLLSAHLNVLLALERGPMMRVCREPGNWGALVCEDLDGTDAGNEILWLHRSAQRVLGEIVQHAETLDGIPCKKCEDYALERAEPPSDPSREAMWSFCVSCRDTMSKTDFDAWAKWYGGWADRQGLACRRCKLGRHDECEYGGCSCASCGHVAA